MSDSNDLVVRNHSEPGWPSTTLRLCRSCGRPAPSPNDDCQEPHGHAHPRDVARHLCAAVGHVVTANGHPVLRCLRCGASRAQVVV